MDGLFRSAVEAIDSGDLQALERILAEHPNLACQRLEHPGMWLRDSIGSALDGFFSRPYLLWFVAEDPVRRGSLPPNIAELARAIVDVARVGCKDLQEQLDYALSLVAWSWVAQRSGVQLALIDVLLDSGASPHGAPENALVNGHIAAAEHLIRRGAKLSLPTAVVLERWDQFEPLAEAASTAEKQAALTLASLRGKPEGIRRLVAIGADPNVVSEHLYSHAFPLHHAVDSGSLEAVRTLVEFGARLDLRDSVHGGTPLGWAEYLSERPNYEPIVAHLRHAARTASAANDGE